MSASTTEAPKEEKPVKNDEDKKATENKSWKGGEVVWAKVPGFNYWPGKVFSSTEDLVPEWLKGAPEVGDVLIRFFGTYDMEWVDPKHVEGYEKGLQKKFQSKNKRKIFVKAVKEAKLFVEKSELPDGMKLQPKRLQSSDSSEPEPEHQESPPPRAKRTATRKATPANKKGRKKQKVDKADKSEDSDKEEEEEEEEEEESKTATE